MARPPRPLEAVVVECVGGTETRRAWVLHDGRHGWVIEEDGERLVTFSGSSGMVVPRDGEVVAVRGELVSGGWLKYLFRGELMDLAHATGEVLSESTVLGRACVFASVRGLRSDDRRAKFNLVVDTHDGIIMRLERPDAELEVTIESIRTASTA